MDTMLTPGLFDKLLENPEIFIQALVIFCWYRMSMALITKRKDADK